MVHKCSVPNCPSIGKGITMHRFPKDPELLKIWLTTIASNDLLEIPADTIRRNRRVCGMHFSQDQRFPKNRSRTDLKARSVPNIHINLPKGFFKYTEDHLLTVSKPQEKGSQEAPQQCTSDTSVNASTGKTVLLAETAEHTVDRCEPELSLIAEFVTRAERDAASDENSKAKDMEVISLVNSDFDSWNGHQDTITIDDQVDDQNLNPSIYLDEPPPEIEEESVADKIKNTLQDKPTSQQLQLKQKPAYSVFSEKCAVLNCTSKKGQIPLHLFPKYHEDQARFMVWLKSTGREGKVKPEFAYICYRICHKHFANEDKSGTRLVKGAIPKLFLPVTSDTSSVNQSEEVREIVYSIQEIVSPRRKDETVDITVPQDYVSTHVPIEEVYINCLDEADHHLSKPVSVLHNMLPDRSKTKAEQICLSRANKKPKGSLPNILRKRLPEAKVENDTVTKTTTESSNVTSVNITYEDVLNLLQSNTEQKRGKTHQFVIVGGYKKLLANSSPQIHKRSAKSIVNAQTIKRNDIEVLESTSTKNNPPARNVGVLNNQCPKIDAPTGKSIVSTLIINDNTGELLDAKNARPTRSIGILNSRGPKIDDHIGKNIVHAHIINDNTEDILDGKNNQATRSTGILNICSPQINANTAKSIVNAHIINQNDVEILDAKNDNATRNIGIQTNPNFAHHQHSNQKKLFLSSETIASMCRICLAQPGEQNLHENELEGLDYSEILEYIIGLRLEEGSPRTICRGCEEGLIKSYMFKKQSQKSEHVLQMFKAELVQKNQKMNILDAKKRLLDHDYESTIFDLNDQPVKKMKAGEGLAINPNDPSSLVSVLENSDPITNPASIPKESSSVISFPAVSNLTPKFPENKKLVSRFYMYKGNIDDDVDYTKLVEIDSKKAMNLSRNKRNYKKVYWCPTEHRAGTIGGMPIINRNRNIIRRAFQLATIGRIEEAKKLTQSANAKIPRKLLRIMNRKPKSEKVTYPTDCNTCGEHLGTEQDYKTHVGLTKHFHTPFPCDHCSKVFPSERRLQSHKASLLQTSRLCDKCGTSFNTTSGLQNHVKLMHSGMEKYKCGVCGKSQADLRHLIRHRRLVHPGVHAPKTVVCELCGLKLGTRASLYAHKRRVHFQIRPLICAICDAKFHTRAQLKKHESVHSLERFDCGFCNVIFKHQEKFDNHRKLRHPALSIDMDVTTEYSPSHCTFCEVVCPNKQALSVHLKEHRIEVCIFCDDIFRGGEELENHHMELHENISEWTCRYCNKCYDDVDGLYTHLTIHKYRSFKCDECPKMFDTSNKLKRHKLFHEGVMNYGCRFCPRRFMYNTSAVIHERIHTGERPYKCDICGSSHMCSSSRSKHRQSHFINPEDSLNMEILAMEAHQ